MMPIVPRLKLVLLALSGLVVATQALDCGERRVDFRNAVYQGKEVVAFKDDDFSGSQMQDSGVCGYQRLFASDDTVLNVARQAWNRCGQFGCDCQWFEAASTTGSCHFCRQWFVRICGAYKGWGSKNFLVGALVDTPLRYQLAENRHCQSQATEITKQLRIRSPYSDGGWNDWINFDAEVRFC